MGPDQGSSLLVEGDCTQHRLRLAPAPLGGLPVGYGIKLITGGGWRPPAV